MKGQRFGHKNGGLAPKPGIQFLILFNFFISPVFSAGAEAVYQTEITLNLVRVPLRAALDAISSQTGIQFVFKDGMIEPETASISCRHTPVAEALFELFKEKNFYSIPFDDHQIILTQAMIREKGMLTGAIYDAGTHAPIPNANLVLSLPGWGTTSNAAGYFQINYLPCGFHQLQARVMGYLTEKCTVAVMPEQIVRLELYLQPTILQGQPVIIEQDKYYFQAIAPIATHQFTNQAIRSIPLVGEADLNHFLQSLPGVVALSDFDSHLYVRGGRTDENLVLLDGMTVYNPYHFLSVFGVFDPDMIQQAELHKGGFGADIGGRLSSVLNVRTSENLTRRFNGKAHLSLLSSKLFLEGPIKNGSWLFNARTTYIDKFVEAISDNRFPVDFYDVFGKLNLYLNRKTRLNFQSFISRDFWGGDSKTDPARISGNRVLGARLEHTLTPSLFFNVNLYRSEYQTKYETVPYEYGFQTSRLVDHSLQVNGCFQSSPIFRLDLGTFFSHFDYRYHFESVRQLMKTQSFSEAGFFLNSQWRLSSLFLIETGLRWHYFQSNRKGVLEPRWQIQYTPEPGTVIRGAYGRYHQGVLTLTDEESRLIHYTLWTNIEAPNPPEQADHYILGLEQQLLFDIKLSLEGYVKRYKNYLEFDWENAAEDKFLFKSGTGKAQGLELLFLKQTGKFYGWCSYSLAKVTGTYGGESCPLQHDRRHNLNAVSGIRFNEKWHINFRFAYGSGLPYTTIKGLYYKGSMYGITPEYRNFPINGNTEPTLFYGARNTARFPDYHRLDFSVTRVFLFSSWKMQLDLNVLNLLAQKNFFYYDESRAQKQFPVLPTLGVRIEF